LVALAWGASGCISPRDDYDDFAKRPLAVREAGVVDVELTPCQTLLGQDLSGSFYTSCLPKDLPIPFALATTQKVTANEDGTTGTLELSFTPLKTDATKMSDTTGPVTKLAPTMIDSMCAYTLNIGTLTLGAEANSLMRDLTATDVVLRGKLQSIDRSCAELDGKVDLIMLSLMMDGDHCIFVRAPADGPIPVVNDWTCDPAGLHPRDAGM
jgi:hypothetical protein